MLDVTEGCVGVVTCATSILRARLHRRSVHDFTERPEGGQSMKTWIIVDPSFAMRALWPSVMS